VFFRCINTDSDRNPGIAETLVPCGFAFLFVSILDRGKAARIGGTGRAVLAENGPGSPSTDVPCEALWPRPSSFDAAVDLSP